MADTYLRETQRLRDAAASERDALRVRISGLDDLIGAYDTVVASLSELPSTQAAAAPTVASGGGPMTVSQAVLAVLGKSDALPLPFAELLLRVNALTTVPDTTLRGTLPRMERAGEIVRAGRGVYALPENHDSPVGHTGLSVVPATTAEEGGASAQADRDHHHLSGWQHADGRDPASIAEG